MFRAGLITMVFASLVGAGAQEALPASAACSWTGTWDTLISGDPQPMTLVQAGASVTGSYATHRRIIGGAVAGPVLTGRWQSAKDAGRFRFTHAEDCGSFTGTWGLGELENGESWTGRRVGLADAVAPPPTVEEVATGLKVPWSLAFGPDRRLFIAQQPCRISVLLPAGAGYDPNPRHLLTLPACVDVGDGLRGLALSPDFAQTGHLFVAYSYRRPDGTLATCVTRFTERSGTLSDEQVVLSDIPGGEFHTAGRLKFGPDGKLYLATGDALVPALAQEPASLAGKILRFNPDGSVPADNPVPTSYVYSSGHRNPQGLAWHPTTGELFVVDHGPSPTIAGEPFTRGHDEINRVMPGSNYGWPLAAGHQGDARFARPLLESGDGTWAPSSALFYTGDRLAAWKNSLFYGGLIGQHLGRVTIAGPAFDQAQGPEKLLQGAFGRIRDVAQGPDGYVYFVTSNTDGRSGAQARHGDDRLLRVVALPSSEERRSLVRSAYLGVLGREPEPDGAHYWAFSTLTGDAILVQLTASPEGRRVEAVRALYRELLLRDPLGADNGGLRSWVDGGLELASVRAAMMTAPEVQRVLAIRALYRELLARDDDLAGIRYWASSPLTLDQIRIEFMKSDEYRRRHP